MASRPSDVIFGEFSLGLGDRRRDRRARQLVDQLAELPESSVPNACPDWASQLGAYRFFANEHVAPTAFVDALGRATASRAAGRGRLLLILDTTSLDYTAHPATDGLGPLDNQERRGLLLHSALVATEDGAPVGIIDADVWARVDHAGARDRTYRRVPIEGRESVKWLRPVRRARERLGADVELVVVADREADVYELYQLAHESEVDWVIRARSDRRLAGTEQKLVELVERSPVVETTTIAVGRQAGQPARTATVTVQASRVTLVPPLARAREEQAAWWQTHPTTERLAPRQLEPRAVGVVLVTEPGPPAGVAPLRWLLVTSLPIETVEQVRTVIAIYRRRWLIERIHFVLKSGCRVERLQMSEGSHLARALLVYLAIAWFLVWLTEQARATPAAACSGLLEEDAWRLLLAVTRQSKVARDQPPDLRTATRLLASLGGFRGRKGDGEPGVQTLWRGFRRFTDLLAGWRLPRDTQVPASF